ncbi:MAG: alpha/beta hydrolase [Dehalococcoidales bacterium]|nr:alpha/beta hydrolase [Dehalococcoidales bacterium]
MEVAVEDRWALVNGVKIHYLVAGEAGSPVLLLHGGGLDSAWLSYKFCIGPLARRHRVFAPDWPGYGASDKPDLPYTTGLYVGLLARLMEILGLESASLAGVSLGGAVALGLALAAPRRVDKLVLADSHGLGWQAPGGILSYLFLRLPFVNELSWAIVARSRRLVEWSLRSIVYDPSVITADLVDEVYEMLQQPGVAKAWRSWQRGEVGPAGLRTNYVNRLHEVAAPTLLIHGDHDGLVPLAWSRRAAALIPRSELVVFPDCGHWSPREKPDEFNSRVLAFLSQ